MRDVTAEIPQPRMVSFTLSAGICVVIVGLAAAAAAGTYNVTRTDDDNVACLGHSCTLREAIMAANDSGDLINLITIPAGRYELTLDDSGNDDENDDFKGDLDITSAILFLGDGSSSTIIDANYLFRVFDLHPGAIVTFNGVTITKGFVTASTGAAGGGIRCRNATVTLTDATVTESSALAGGGIDASQCTISIENDSLVARNLALEGSGGGIFFETGSLEMTDSTISGNSASHHGGGLYVLDTLEGQNVNLERSTISRNTSEDLGGGIYIAYTYTYPFMENCTISGNAAYQGGAIGVGAFGGARLNHLTLVDNDASLSDSAVYSAPLADRVDFKSSVVSGTCNDSAWITSGGGNVESPGQSCLEALNSTTVADPLLWGLSDFGGPTQVHLPKVGSPVIDAGIDCPDLDEDQRGLIRPSKNCDSGAVERQLSDPEPIFIDGFESGGITGWSASS